MADPSITFTIEVPQFDGKKFTQAFQKRVQEAMREAAGKFYVAAIGRIPIWTGFVAGSFGNLRAELRTKEVLGATPRAARARKRISQFREYYRGDGGRTLKTPVSGRRFSTPRDQIFVNDGKGNFKFQYSVNINYFQIQDIRNIGRSRSAPWLAIKAGTDALREYFANNVNTQKIFPPLTDYLEIVTYTVRKDGRLTKVSSRKSNAS